MDEAQLVRPIVAIIMRELTRATEHVGLIQRLMGEAHALVGHTDPSVTRDCIAVAEQALQEAERRIREWDREQAMVIPLSPRLTTETLNAKRPQPDTA